MMSEFSIRSMINEHQRASGDLIAWRSPAVLIALLLVPMFWFAYFMNNSFEKQRALRQAASHGTNVAQIFQESTERIFLGVDRSLHLIRFLYERDPAGFDLMFWAKNALMTSDGTLQFALIGRDGFLIASTNGYKGPPLYLGDREHFVRTAELADDVLYIATPVLGRVSGKWSIQVARRLNAADGSFAGVVVGSIDPDLIGSFFETAQLGENGSIILRNSENVVLAARGSTTSQLGRKFSPPPLQAALDRAPNGTYWGGGAVDGINRLVAYRKSDKLPLLFAVGLAERRVFSEYRYQQKIYLTLTMTLTMILLAAAWWDFTGRRTLARTQRKLIDTRTFLDTVIQNIPMPISIKDPRTKQFILVNRAFEALIGVSRADILGNTVFAVFPSDVAAVIAKYDLEAENSLHQVVNGDVLLETVGNGQRVVTTTRLVARDQDQQPQYLITIIDDVTERKRSEAKIELLAHYDALTGLANRNLFKVLIEKYLARARREQTEFGVLLLDLDKFKLVNDGLGHQAGDTLLERVSGRIKASIRDVDVAARMGGDEFALLIEPGENALQDWTETLAARLIDVIGKPYEIDGRKVVIGCSIGIVLVPEHGGKSDQLLKYADLALYKSKNSGRNCFRTYSDDLRIEADNRNELENDLREAIWREEFELHYQPVVATRSGNIKSVEALVRWRHPTRGLLAPDLFIPLAEETGLIVKLGEWIATRACRDAMKMPHEVKLAVNLSPVQFSKSNIVEMIALALSGAHMQPERLEVEITEGILLQETDQNLETLRRLKEMGVSIALDDFGVGYSSLGYLTSFPFDKVKIDKKFIRAIDKPESRAILSSIVQLSRSLNLSTVAEGIETQDELAEVDALGVELSQGYYFSRPVPLADLDLSVVYSIADCKAA
jgi:diguanylate cyclase (GGDEF)-like protein/PAS domain S-box-containing protein